MFLYRLHVHWSRNGSFSRDTNFVSIFRGLNIRANRNIYENIDAYFFILRDIYDIH